MQKKRLYLFLEFFKLSDKGLETANSWKLKLGKNSNGKYDLVINHWSTWEMDYLSFLLNWISF